MLKNIFLKIARRFETPVYVYDENTIRKNSKILKKYLPNAKLYFACKANNNPQIIKIIKSEGIGIETVSFGEIKLAKSLGFLKNQISFTASNIDEKELIYASKNTGVVNLDSLNQIKLWGENKLGKFISLRINTGIGAGHHSHVVTGGNYSKFGIILKDLKTAQDLAKKYGLIISSLHQHIGSNIYDYSIMLKAIEKLLVVASNFKDLNHIDFGGGFGMPYRPTDKSFDFENFGKKLNVLIKDFENRIKRKINYSFEPGRFLVAQAGNLLVKVTDIKKTPQNVFVGVNSGFNHLIRPAMYDSYHHITNLNSSNRPKIKLNIAGNICESGDLFAKNRIMPLPKIGDILVIQNAGAYGITMASNYNLRPLPKEILITKNLKIKNISFSRENFLKI